MGKIIFDPIHKYMNFESILLKIIDTPEFQRLKNIKQLGLCYYVFPGASHNRFEHSIGVSHLSGLMAKHLQKNQPELNITDRIVILIKIAGLVHDIGHACFSHFFDHHFLHDKIHDNPLKDHEIRSCKLFEYMVEKYNIGLLPEEVNQICRIIDPLNDDNSFIYQIVANKINGLDCDKFDYIARDTYNVGLSYSFDSSRLIEESRVIDDKICYPKKCYFEISDLYHTRYKLHKQIYTHKCVRAIEYMVLDIIKELDKDINLIDKITDITKFYQLTDNILELCYYNNNQKAINIYKNIQMRNLYKLICELPIENFYLKEFNKQLSNNKLKDSFIIDEIKLNYSMNKKNPLDFVTLYKNLEIVDKKNISFLFPKKFEEEIVRIYCRDKEHYNEMYNFVNKFIKK